jgi:hypothetical protein
MTPRWLLAAGPLARWPASPSRQPVTRTASVDRSGGNRAEANAAQRPLGNLAAGRLAGHRARAPERRWSTPELLVVEQQLVERVTCRTDEQAAVASHQAVRDALAAHPTAGPDQ